MRRFLDLSTRGKLYATFGLMIVLLAVVAALAYRSVILIQESQRALYEQEFSDVLDIKEIRANQIAVRDPGAHPRPLGVSERSDPRFVGQRGDLAAMQKVAKGA